MESLKSLLGLGTPCPKCGETLDRRPLFTVPADERLLLASRFLELGSFPEDGLRAELESLLGQRRELPRDVSSGVRAAFEHCRACKFGRLSLELLKDGDVRETRLHAATGAGYAMLYQLLGGA